METSLVNRIFYNGDGATVDFGYNFRVFEKTDFRVLKIAADYSWTELAVDTDYTVTGLGEASGGNVHLTGAPPAIGEAVCILRKPPMDQKADIRNEADFFPETHEDEFDRIVHQLQAIKAMVDRSVRIAPTEDGEAVSLETPARQTRAYTILGFDFDGDIALYSVGQVGGPITATYIVKTAHPQLPGALVIQGVANRITVTDDGLGHMVVSTPQDIGMASSPSFVGVSLAILSPSALSPGQITSDQNNYTIGQSYARLFSDAARAITGIIPFGVGGQSSMLVIANVGSFNITLKNQNASSTAANRIITGTGADLVVAPDQTVMLIYDLTTQRWRVFKNA